MTKEYKPNKMEQQILDDVNSMATSLKEISQAVNVFVNGNLNNNIRKDARDFVYITNEITKNKQAILKLFNILK